MSGSGWVGEVTEAADNIAAGDEVEQVEDVLRHISGQLEALGAGEAVNEDPLGHIVVPGEGAGLALPAGEAMIDFKNGRVEHSELDEVVEEIVDIRELSRAIDDSELSLRNLIFHVDGVASVTVEGNENQDVFFQDVPIPFRGFEEVTLSLPYPCEVSVLASTRELPISLGAVTASGQRHGEHSAAVTDSFDAVPVAPFDLWDEHGATYAKAPVYVANFDSVSVTVDNTSGNTNQIEAEVQAKESTSPSAEWRTIGSDTVPDGDHSIFSITERHKLLRTRVKNTAAGENVAASVDYNFANP